MTQLDPSMISVRLGTSQPGGTFGANWFGPLMPMPPVAPPEVAGRQFDYQPGRNLVQRPREYEAVTFDTLRGMADAFDLVRTAIETRKDQFEKIPWQIRGRTYPGKQKPEAISPDDVRKFTEFFEMPDRENDFFTWHRMLLEDVLVIDAPTLWKERTVGGELVGLQVMDGATIKRVINEWGRTPSPYVDEHGGVQYPAAYQQILKGMAAVDYQADEIIYAPRNKRSNKVYGFSPVEQILVTINIALRRQAMTLAHFTAGNIPQSLIGVPDTWTPDQIRSFQDYWDLTIEGDAAARRKGKFVPGGVAKTFIQTQDPELKGVFDEWLAKLVCFAFSISPQALISQVNRATANTQREQADEEGLAPLMKWSSRLINRVIHTDFGRPDVEFAWGTDKKLSPQEEATIYSTYVNNGTMSRNEVREKIGLEASDVPEAAELGFTTGSGFVHLDETKKPEPEIDPITGLSPVAGVGTLAPPKEDDDGTETDRKDTAEKFEKNDWEHQPRDDKGRFGSGGGPTARERAKAERAKNAAESDTARDKMGRFTGSLTMARAKKIAMKVGAQVGLAAGAAGAAYLAAKWSSKTESLFADVLKGTAAKLSKDLMLQSAEMGIAAVLRYQGFDADTATRMAQFARRTTRDYLEAKAEAAKKSAKAAEKEAARIEREAEIEAERKKVEAKVERNKRRDAATIKAHKDRMATSEAARKAKRSRKKDVEKLMKSMSPAELITVEEISDLAAIAHGFLPSMLDSSITHTLSDIEENDNFSDEDIDLLSDEMEEARDEILEALQDLSGVVKKVEVSTPSLDRRAARRAVAKAAGTVSGALRRAFKANRTSLAAGVKELLDGLSKAVQPSEPGAARLAAAMDLDAVREVYIALGDDLANASTDAARKVLASMGVSVEEGENVVSKAAQWAADHAAEITGQRVLDDGTIVKTTGGGYDITESTQKIVRDIVSSGMRSGLSVEDIMSKIEEQGFSEERARNIAEFEVGTANSAGALEGYKSARDMGVEIVGKRWVTVGDEHVDNDICQKNEDQGTIPFDQEFQSGHMHPLGHPRCRCVLVPVFADDSDFEDDDEMEQMDKYSDDQPRDGRGRWSAAGAAAGAAIGSVAGVAIGATYGGHIGRAAGAAAGGARAVLRNPETGMPHTSWEANTSVMRGAGAGRRAGEVTANRAGAGAVAGAAVGSYFGGQLHDAYHAIREKIAPVETDSEEDNG